MSRLCLQACQHLPSLDKMTIGRPSAGELAGKELNLAGSLSRPSSNRPLNSAEGESGRVCTTCGTTKAKHWRKIKGSDRFNCKGCFLAALYEKARAEGRIVKGTGPRVSYQSL
jgi:hypothetical protein